MQDVGYVKSELIINFLHSEKEFCENVEILLK